MGKRICLLGILMLVSILSWSFTEAETRSNEMIDEQIMNLMKRLDKLEQREQFALLSKVDEQRRELLGVLMKYMGTSSSLDVQAAAAYLIGRHRLSEGVTALMGRIEFDAASIPTKGPEPLWERYPAMEALITIGRPSVRPAMELLATEDDQTRRELAVKVIRYVEGSEVAEFILQRELAAELDSVRRARLEGAIDRLRKLPR
jgi:hypothetical protein